MKRFYLCGMVMLLYLIALSGFARAQDIVQSPVQDTLKGTISGLFWIDSNGNGDWDAGESPVTDIDVELFDKDNKSFAVTTTDASTGRYTFTKVPAGNGYYVKFTIPAEMSATYKFTDKKGNIDDPNNSDVNDSGKTAGINISKNNLEHLYVDAGLKLKTPLPPQLGSIGDMVFEDKDKDGLKGSGENGLAEVFVDLYLNDANGNPVWQEQTKTNGSGKYKFSNLVPGTYLIKFTIPDGYEFTQLVGTQDDDDNSDADKNNNGKTKDIVLAAGQNRVNIDAGLFVPPLPPLSTGVVSGYVWLDVNGNGTENGPEPGEDNVIVKLYILNTITNSYVPVGTTTTAGGGLYSFTGLIAGTYKVLFVAPDGYKFTKYLPSDVRGQGQSDADTASGNYGWTVPFEVDPSKSNLARADYVDAGLIPAEGGATGSIGDYVWMDLNGNGEQNDGLEPGVSGVKVDLYWEKTPSNFVLLESTTTDANGNYLFSDLIAGTYYVHFNAPSGDKFTKMVGILTSANNSDADPTTGNTVSFQLDPAQPSIANIDYVDAGLLPVEGGKIGDFVWYDCDGDGLQNHGEPGIRLVKVELYSCSNSTPVFLASTRTDIHGYYSFTNLDPGTYCVKFILPDDYDGFTITQADHNDAKDSDAEQNGWTRQITLLAGEINLNIDAGLILKQVKNACIGDFVWKDIDKDGIQESGEAGIPNVMVQLYNWGSNVVLMSTITNSLGKYLFENLEPGDYYVKFVLAEGFTFTKKDQGADDALDSDADPLTGKTDKITLHGENDLTIDAGMYGSDCMPVSIGDFVWNDLNQNGIQNTNEPGIAKVTVNLYKVGETAIHAATMTDANGIYHFAGLLPGTYYLQFVLPSGFAFTLLNQGSNDALDSDANMTTGITGAYELTSGEAETTADAGMIKGQCLLANLGDFVWNDCNRNGIQDAGETGMEGVVLKLHSCTSDHSKADDPCVCGPEIANTKTDKNGKYLFANIMPGRYCVEIVVPCNFTITNPDQGKDDALDSDIIPSMKHTACINLASGQTNLTVDAGLYATPPATIGDFVWIDANKNGIQDNGEKGLCSVTVELYMCGVSKPVASTKTDTDGKYIFKNVIPNTSYSVKFYVPNGYTITSLDQGNNDAFDSDVCPKNNGMTKFYDIMPDQTNLTIDCGMYLSTTTACNYVWKDNNNNGLKDEGEAGINGVTVELYNCSNNSLAKTAQTDETGLYTFSDILLDSYYMKIIIPAGYKIGKAAQDGNGESLSADFGSNGQSSCFDVTEGTTSIGKPIALVLSTTGVTRGSEIPTEFSLLQNYPNPFNPSTTIEFAVPTAGQYTIKIFNMLGQEVSTLLDRELPVGYHMVTFDASRMPSGMYLYRLTGNNVMLIKKMMLSK